MIDAFNTDFRQLDTLDRFKIDIKETELLMTLNQIDQTVSNTAQRWNIQLTWACCVIEAFDLILVCLFQRLFDTRRRQCQSTN